MTYTSLHAHSIYSTLDGHITVDDYVAAVAAQGHTHAALTDHGTMAGLPAFWKACAKHNITPIAGMEAYVSTRPLSERVKESFHLTLLAINRTGYENLVALSSLAWLDGFYYRPRVDLEALAKYAGGLVCLSGCFGSPTSRAIVAEETARVTWLLEFFTACFGERFFLELMNHGQALPEQRIVNQALVGYAGKYGIPAVGTNDSHYCVATDYEAYKTLVAINRKEGLESKELGSPCTWVRTNDEMRAAFGDSALLHNTLAIAAMVEPYELGLGVPRLPLSPWEYLHQHLGPDDILAGRTEDGMLRRLQASCMDDVPLVYQARLEHELRTIGIVSRELGAPLERYFLNIGALAEMLHEREILFSTRGSAAGSLVCWALGISELDPIQHGLLFERFLNPFRVALPDIDLDVPDDRRDEILVWLKETYGEDQIARIGTYARIGAKGALKDAARLSMEHLSRDYKLVGEELSALVPHHPNPKEQTLESVLSEEGSALAAARSKRDADTVISLAERIAGRFRGPSTHAAGVIIADAPIREITPLMQVKKVANAIITDQTQFEMGDLEDIGLIKFDLLGLSELSKMKTALDMIAEIHNEHIDIWALDWEDEITWDVICEGSTLGLFQLSGPGMTRLVVQMQPRTMPELAQIAAIFRPGPLANRESIVARRQGREPIASIHPDIDDIVAHTYGYPVFQEDLLKIVQRVAGYSVGEADVLRKAIGKKDAKLMRQKGVEFAQRMAANGYSEAETATIWGYIVPFADYGFNLAHATAYAHTAFQSAYLKAHYPAIFYTAALETEAHDKERIGQLVHEARHRGVTILPPDVNVSQQAFTVEGEAVRYGLDAIKGTSHQGMAAIVAAQPFSDLRDLVERARAAKKDDLETVIAAGATPPEWGSRPSQTIYLAELLAIKGKKVYQRKGRKGKGGETKEEALARQEQTIAELFAEAVRPPEEMETPIVERLQSELELLGMTHSPFPQIPGTLAITQLDGQHEQVAVAGIIQSLEPKISRRGNNYARITLLDGTGLLSGMIWPQAWAKTTVREGDHVYVSGRVVLDGEWEGSTAPPPSALRLMADVVVPVEPEQEHVEPVAAPPEVITIPVTTPYAEALRRLTQAMELSREGTGQVTIQYGAEQISIPCDVIRCGQIRHALTK